MVVPRRTGSQTATRRGQSRSLDATEAVREFYAAVAQADMVLVVFFCAGTYDLKALAAEMRRVFADVQVVGCTTAGEIGLDGYCEQGLCGVSFSASQFLAVSCSIERLQKFSFADGYTAVQSLLQRLKAQSPRANAENSFAFMLVDGESAREEPVVHSLQNALGAIPLVGGTTGPSLHQEGAQVYFQGQFHRDSAAVVLVTTPLPFRIFMAQHFVATDERLVVTEAEPARRIVKEINGLPAAQEYARLLGTQANRLTPAFFAANPLVVVIDGTSYVRSIQRSNPDGSLTFFCAVENGLVLRLAKGADIVENIRQVFAQVRSEIGPPQVVLAFDCILRRLEINHSEQLRPASQVLTQNHVIGFSTHGEQFHGAHVNHTLVGIALATEGSGHVSD